MKTCIVDCVKYEQIRDEETNGCFSCSFLEKNKLCLNQSPECELNRTIWIKSENQNEA